MSTWIEDAEAALLLAKRIAEALEKLTETNERMLLLAMAQRKDNQAYQAKMLEVGEQMQKQEQAVAPDPALR